MPSAPRRCCGRRRPRRRPDTHQPCPDPTTPRRCCRRPRAIPACGSDRRPPTTGNRCRDRRRVQRDLVRTCPGRQSPLRVPLSCRERQRRRLLAWASPDFFDLGVPGRCEVFDLAPVLLEERVALGRIECPPHRRLVQHCLLGDLRVVEAADFGNLGALLVGERHHGDALLLILLSQALHGQLVRRLRCVVAHYLSTWNDASSCSKCLKLDATVAAGPVNLTKIVLPPGPSTTAPRRR